MKKLCLLVVVLVFSLFNVVDKDAVFAEERFSQPDGGGKIPKIPKTPNDPILRNGGVYPMWGPVCQRYTYHTIYQDKKGRPPEYVRMFFNGKWIDVQKEDSKDNDYKKGVRYIYKFVPNKLGSNFFFFEASNGVGKTREGIIDSPGNGPVLFEGDFLDNEIALIDPKSGEKIWKFPTKEEWVGGVVLSDDGKYLAAQTSSHIYFFDTKSAKPLWSYGMSGSGVVGGDVKGGVAISADGSRIFASLGSSVYLFKKDSNRPIWQGQSGSNTPYSVAISADGKYMAAATAGDESNQNSNLLILWSEKSSKPLWQYHASGNFHDVSLSADGAYVVGATGCPDRRAYIFSRDSNKPLVKSEMLTYDSPVNTSKISRDGSLAYFSTDGGPQSSVLALFSKNSDKPIWKFNDGINESARAMRITSDGKYVAVANMKGNVYLLGKDSSSPIKRWKINASTGALDIPDDASFLAVGGTDNKVHIFDINSGQEKQTLFDEYVIDITVSGNGKYAAAGTGGSVYFFESFTNENKIFPCTTIIEPKPMKDAMMSNDGQQSGIEENTAGKTPSFFTKIFMFFRNLFSKNQRSIKEDNAGAENDKQGNGVCGNTLCEPALGESKQSCPKDCSGE